MGPARGLEREPTAVGEAAGFPPLAPNIKASARDAFYVILDNFAYFPTEKGVDSLSRSIIPCVFLLKRGAML